MLASPDTVANPSWYVDFGASNHITTDLNNLSIHDAYSGNDQVFIGNGMKLAISHTGSPVLASPAKSLLCVPHITKNLLSVSQLTKDNNVSVEFFADSCVVKSSQGFSLLRGLLENGLYKFSSSPDSPFPSPAAFFGVKTSLQDWYNRLGHPSVDITSRLVSSFSLPISSTKLSSVYSSC